MQTALSLSHIHKHYPHFALQDINLSLPTGEVMGLVGVNGAGKTTLLRILMGLIRPDQGEVQVLGQRMPNAQVAAKAEIGFASEDMRLYASQTLRWHMDFIRSIYPSWDETYAAQLLRRFDLRETQNLRGFSHGQRVKALLLLNLARRPKLLLLDEPTTGLDPVARSEVLDALADVLRDEQRSVLFSSHNTQDVEQLSDSISFLHNGQMLASQDKETFLDSWRRIVCQGAWQADQTAFSEIVKAKQTGSLWEFKARGDIPGLLQRLRSGGLDIRSVESMSLEDIFVTTVRQGASS
jgi:ABC-2 type transport system ATP-binding protein